MTGRCANCDAELTPSARFCSDCGTPVQAVCSSCGAAVSGRFCSECGTPLQAGGEHAAPVIPEQQAAPAPMTVAERRITSVLFGDLVGFTALAESRDPEEVRDLQARYFSTVRTIVERYGGTVEKFIGDAAMAVWGVPTAHEDDAERSVRAGLDLVDAVVSLGEQLKAPELTMRVGVVTGEVAVNVGARGDAMVAGDAVNTASRVQAVAGAGEVWVDEATRTLTAAAVDYDDVGQHELKGKAAPLRLFAARRIVSAIGGARRVDGLEAPFIGRDRELRLVKELFHATLDEGRPRLVAVFGTAGVGKSRLGWEFDKYVDGIAQIVRGHRGRCLSYGEGVAFWALAEMVRGRLGILEGDSAEAAVAHLYSGIEEYVPDPSERDWLLPRVAELIGVADTVAPDSTFTKDELFSAWRTFIERIAGSADSTGAYFRIDDLQWADAGLLEFLDYLLGVAQGPIFIVTHSRPELAERAPAFGTGRRATALYLEPLPEEAMGRLVEGLVAGLPPGVRKGLVERADGVPLYAVETVRALIDRDVVIPKEGRYVLAAPGGDVDLDLPTSLHTLIAARLDALTPAERRVAQNAAVVGQSFSRDDVAAVTDDVDGAALDSALDALVRKEFIAVESDPRSPERGQFRFLQALVRTVAYDTLSRRDRKTRHLAAAARLAEDFDAESIPGVLASHLLAAHDAAPADEDAQELAARAMVLLEKAGERSSALGSPDEATRHYLRALELTDETEARARLTEKAARSNCQAARSDVGGELALQARDLYASLGREVEAARLVAVWGEAQIQLGVTQEAAAVMAETYEQMAAHPEGLRVATQLAMSTGRAHYLGGSADEALPWFDRTITMAEEQEDAEVLASTLSSYGGALIIVGRATMGLGLLRVALELARDHELYDGCLRPLNNLVAFQATRDVRAAIGYATEGLALLRRTGNLEVGTALIGSSLHAYWLAGDWDAAERLWTELGTADDRVTPADLSALTFLDAIATARGHAQPARPPLLYSDGDGAAAPSVYRRSYGNWLLASDAASRGAVAEAARLGAEAVETLVEFTGLDDDYGLFWTHAVDWAVAAGDISTARRVLGQVDDVPRGRVSTYLRAELPRLRALIDAAAHEPDTVDRDLTEAIEALRAFGCPFSLGRALLQRADALVHRGRGDDARSLREEARAIFADLGAKPWEERTAVAAASRHVSLQ